MNIIQLVLVVGLLGVTFCLFFSVVPPANQEIFKMCVTAIISFISGAALGFGYRRDNGKGDSGDSGNPAG